MAFRDDRVGVALGVLAGLCWVVATFRPWSNRGPLSHSSLADVVRLTRDGTIEGLVPSGAALLLLALPAAGIAMIGLGPFAGPLPVVARTLCWCVATLSTVLVAHWLLHGHLDRLGQGVAVSLAGTIVGGTAIIRDLVAVRLAHRARPSTQGEAP